MCGLCFYIKITLLHVFPEYCFSGGGHIRLWRPQGGVKALEDNIEKNQHSFDRVYMVHSRGGGVCEPWQCVGGGAGRVEEEGISEKTRQKESQVRSTLCALGGRIERARTAPSIA